MIISALPQRLDQTIGELVGTSSVSRATACRTLRRLVEHGLERHAGETWALAPRALEGFGSSLAEAATNPDMAPTQGRHEVAEQRGTAGVAARRKVLHASRRAAYRQALDRLAEHRSEAVVIVRDGRQVLVPTPRPDEMNFRCPDGVWPWRIARATATQLPALSKSPLPKAPPSLSWRALSLGRCPGKRPAHGRPLREGDPAGGAHLRGRTTARCRRRACPARLPVRQYLTGAAAYGDDGNQHRAAAVGQHHHAHPRAGAAGEEFPLRVPAALGRDTTALDAVDIPDPAGLFTDGCPALVVAEGNPQEVAGQPGLTREFVALRHRTHGGARPTSGVWRGTVRRLSAA
ncbi:hypothetical protein [Streptomyces sp. NBC_01615]|uniref:hypothetical protein n=1 Tax=Streptomyces sp. NBC_01615 TaxID=2975898 RepID=UPI003865024A